MTGPAIATLENLAIRLVVAVALALAAWLLVQARAYLAAHTTAKQRQNLADLALQICSAAEQQYRGRTSAGAEKFSWADGKLHNALPKLSEAQRKTLIEAAVRAVNAGVVALPGIAASITSVTPGLAPYAAQFTPLLSSAESLATEAGAPLFDAEALKADVLGAVGALARQEVAAAAPGALADAFTRLTTAAAPPDPAPAPPLPSASAKTLHIVESANHDDVVGVVIQPSSADTTATAGLVTTSGEPERPASVLPFTPSTSPTATP
jgi:hypothetical protein